MLSTLYLARICFLKTSSRSSEGLCPSIPLERSSDMAVLNACLLGKGYSLSTVFPHIFGRKIVHIIHKASMEDKDAALLISRAEK
ncbi:hypothetical protein D3C87_1185940 [compost metagenome]